MTNPFERLAKAQDTHTSRTGEEVIYTPYQETTLPLVVSVQNGNALNSNDEYFSDAITFMNVKLPFKPKPTDKVTHDATEYHVTTHTAGRSFMEEGADGVSVKVTLYDIVCHRKSHNPTNHNNYRRR